MIAVLSNANFRLQTDNEKNKTSIWICDNLNS